MTPVDCASSPKPPPSTVLSNAASTLDLKYRNGRDNLSDDRRLRGPEQDIPEWEPGLPPDGIHFKVDRETGTATAFAFGAISSEVLVELGELLYRALRGGCTDLALDLARCRVVPPSCAGLLNRLADTAQRFGGRLTVRGIGSFDAMILRADGLVATITIEPRSDPPCSVKPPAVVVSESVDGMRHNHHTDAANGLVRFDHLAVGHDGGHEFAPPAVEYLAKGLTQG